MKQTWADYETAEKQGPLAFGIKAVIGLALLVGLIMLIGIPFGWFSEASTVTREQFGPRAAVVKYEWFKDAAAAMEQKKATLGIYEKRLAGIAEGYGADRSKWPRDVREQHAIVAAEMAGIEASYNQLASEYNANMSKVNWQFASGELPREIAPYTTGR